MASDLCRAALGEAGILSTQKAGSRGLGWGLGNPNRAVVHHVGSGDAGYSGSERSGLRAAGWDWEVGSRQHLTRCQTTHFSHPPPEAEAWAPRSSRSSSSGRDATLGIEILDSCGLDIIEAGVREHLHWLESNEVG